MTRSQQASFAQESEHDEPDPEREPPPAFGNLDAPNPASTHRTLAIVSTPGL